MSDALAPAACLNCGHALAPPGGFCPRCGQAPAHRLSTGHVLWSELRGLQLVCIGAALSGGFTVSAVK